MIPKFRAYIKEKNEIWEVTDIDFLNLMVGVIPIGGTTEDRDFIGTEKVILLQFTGLTDKNGNEIYKGHILRKGTYWNIIIDGLEKGSLKIRGTYCTGTNGIPIDTYEIIGDIYTTPELLKS